MKRIATAFVAGLALAGSSALVQAQTDPRVDCTRPGMAETSQCRGGNQQQPGAAGATGSAVVPGTTAPGTTAPGMTVPGTTGSLPGTGTGGAVGAAPGTGAGA